MLTAHLPNDYQGAQTCPRGHCISQQSQCKAANMPSASSGRNPWALWHSAALWMMTRLFILSTATAQLLQGVVLPFGLGKGSTSLHVHKLISLPFSNKTKAFVAGLDNLFIGEPLQCHWRGEKRQLHSLLKCSCLKQDAATGSQSTTLPSRLGQEVNSTIN